MKGLEVGGLALIIDSDDESHVGRCVLVTEMLVDDRLEHLRGGELLGGHADGSLSAVVELEGSGLWLYLAASLMPIQGDPDAVVSDEKELALS